MYRTPPPNTRTHASAHVAPAPPSPPGVQRPAKRLEPPQRVRPGVHAQVPVQAPRAGAPGAAHPHRQGPRPPVLSMIAGVRSLFFPFFQRASPACCVHCHLCFPSLHSVCRAPFGGQGCGVRAAAAWVHANKSSAFFLLSSFAGNGTVVFSPWRPSALAARIRRFCLKLCSAAPLPPCSPLADRA